MEPGFPVHVWWDDEHGIARNDWEAGSICSLAEARKVTSAVAAFGRGPVPVLVDMRYLRKAEREAREHFTSEDAQATAVALLVSSAVSKVVANFIIGLQRMPVPTRMFTDEGAATGWLSAYRA
ncbi:hypothetical protein ABIB25_001056 [Nakamurella sp. UYEF19]|uniref:DUF7793 family protein n=1 Tax=Nakamurella sp. UYEF19 TaxID=1756392 RepID=UPI0033988DCC